jgi:hypothetical protein
MLFFVILVDVSVVILCSVALAKYGRLRHSHPATIYLVFHLLIFTVRLIAISLGSPTLFSQWGFTKHGFTDPVSENEIARAVLIADLALFIMTAGWVRAAFRANSNQDAMQEGVDEEPTNISKKLSWSVIAVALPIGVVAFVLLSRFPGIDVSASLSLPQTAWIGITQTWAGLCLIALIYLYGFRLKYLIPLLAYLFVQMLQGFHRLRFVIPVILLSMIYLDTKEKRWPSLRVVLVIAIVALLFSPMKQMGKMFQAGVPLTEVLEYTVQNMEQDWAEYTFLDQYAASLTLVDQHGKWFLGREWAYLVGLMWIPRPLWPDKPHMAGFVREISIPSRPMGEMGMIVTFLGDAYAHFRYLGILLLPYLLAYWSGRFYFRAYRDGYGTATHLLFLLLSCNLIQLYRDGTFYIITWVAVYMMPLFLIGILHLLFCCQGEERVGVYRFPWRYPPHKREFKPFPHERLFPRKLWPQILSKRKKSRTNE